MISESKIEIFLQENAKISQSSNRVAIQKDYKHKTYNITKYSFGKEVTLVISEQPYYCTALKHCCIYHINRLQTVRLTLI